MDYITSMDKAGRILVNGILKYVIHQVIVAVPIVTKLV